MRVPIFAMAAAALSGCAGFTPLYGAQGATAKLAAIQVVQPSGRLGFLTREYLDDSLARDTQQKPIYRLGLAMRELRVARGITVANVASRYEVDLNTTYTLTEIATNKEVTRGQVSVNVTYDVVSQPYAALSAEQDGERRAAEQAADRIRLELATYFASPRPTQPAAALAPVNQSTYSERTPGALIQSPREQALGQLAPEGGQADTFGQTRQSTTTDDQAQPFSPSEDPNAIKTLPDTSGSGQ